MPDSKTFSFQIPLLLLCCLVALTGLGSLANSFPLLGLLAHFRFHLSWGLFFCLWSLWGMRRSLMWKLGLVSMLFNLLQVAPVYWVNPSERWQASQENETLKLVSFNLLWTNQQYEEVQHYLEQEQADVMVLLELTPVWAEMLDPLINQYPYRMVLPDPEYNGMALLSKYPLDSASWIWPGNSSSPVAYSEVNFNEQVIRIVGMHPLAPTRIHKQQRRDEQLEALGKLLADQSSPLVMVGDYNITTHHPALRHMQSRLNLQDSRQGIGRQPSWPVSLGIWGLPIDHCLVSPSVKVLRRELGPILGSDHRPLVVELALRQKADG